MPRLDTAALIKMYKAMSEEARQEELDAVFDIMFALLEALECDSIECMPNPSVRLSFRCDIIRKETQYIC